jgi:hypothetical protein
MIRLSESLPMKPTMGDACNGCGICCAIQPCAISIEIIGRSSGRCQALEVNEGRTYCGIVRRPAYYMFGDNVDESKTGDISVLFAAALGIGIGCDASDDLI